MCRELKDPAMIINSLSGLGQFYTAKGKWAKARQYIEECYELSKMMNALNELETTTGLLSEIYEKLGEHDLALAMYEEHLEVHEGNKNDNEQREIMQTEYEMKYRLQSSQDSIANAVKLAEAEELHGEQQRTRDAQISKKNWQQVGLFGGLLLVIVFSAIVFNRFRLTNKQKETIKIQHDKLEEKNKEVLSSISYAKRIQDAILPPRSFFQSLIPDSFILYRPKDIVAGDFYWLEKSGDLIFLAVADCTGHGVPGAMVSVVCHNALNRSLREFRLTKPGEILNKSRELIIETFEKSESEVKDGMDISLIAWNTKSNVMEYAGANNSIYCVKGTDIEIITANKQPVGVYVDPKPFETKVVNVGKGDIVYLFSDGFADQFGGDKGKKMKYNNFRGLIGRIALMPLVEQGVVFETEFNKWRGDFEQIDDVCVIGLRL